jgi:Notch-like protein
MPSNQIQFNIPTNVSNFPFPNIKMTPVTSSEIKDIIKSLKWKNSKGYDEIPQSILKISMPFILSPLFYICNKSLSLGIFPMRLKYSQISPTFKKGDKTVITNYRPMSLLTFFSKFFKKAFTVEFNII